MQGLPNWSRTYLPDQDMYKYMTAWWFYVLNGLWIIVVTMTTVGFGEAYPTTYLGRIIGFFACVVGMLLMSLMVVALTNQTEFSSSESKAFDFLQRVTADDYAKEKAANVIRKALQMAKLKRNGGKLAHLFIAQAAVAQECNVFSGEYKYYCFAHLPNL